MSSELLAIEAATLRLASAKKWSASASRTLEFAKFRVKSAETEVEASYKEMQEAWGYLMSLQNNNRATGMDDMSGVNYAKADNNDEAHNVSSTDDSSSANEKSIQVEVSNSDDAMAGSEFSMIKIYVRGCPNAADGNLPLKVWPSDTIANVKTMIQAKLNIPPKHFYLTYDGKFLEDAVSLADYKIKKRETIQFYLRRRSHGPTML